MKIQKTIWCLLLLFIGGLAYLLIFRQQNIQRNKESFQWVNHTHETIENINEVHSSLLDVESQLRGYVLTGNPLFISDYDRKKESLFSDIDSLQKLTANSPDQQKNVLALQELANQKIAFQDKVFTQFSSSPAKAQALIAGLQGKKITDKIETILSQMGEKEGRLLAMRMDRYYQNAKARLITTIVIAAAALVLFSIFFIKIVKEIRLRRQAEEKTFQSEQKYKGLIENSALVVYATDLEGNFTYVSGKCKEFTGFTAEELMGEPVLTIVKEDWREKAKNHHLQQIQNQTFETVLELPIVSKTGEVRWLEQSTVLLQEGGKVTGFQTIAKDITERKYGERLLAETEQLIKAKQEEYQERLQAILDNMPMIVYLKDLQGQFIMVNKQFHQTFGTTDEQVIGKTEMNVHRNERDNNRFSDADEQVRKQGKPVEIEASLLTSEGERDMLVIKFPLYDKNNELFAISAVGKDITEAMRHQRQLVKAKKRAEQAERLQEEFLANMSHEIRTPMNGIIGMTNLMETTALNNEQREYLHLIKESSGILLTLINDILDLSKIKSGRMSVETVDFNLHRTIDSIIAQFRVKASEKDIGLNKVFQDVPRYVQGDQHKLQQVLNNLLSNAVKFTQEGAVNLTATTERKSDGTLSFVCTVSDTGIGISPENLEHVFEAFVQAGNDMVRRFGGTGLGLAITKRLIELQGGKITASSVLGKGTSFRIELPFALGTGSSEETPVVEQQQNRTISQSLKGKRILLIEDNLVNQKVTRSMLHKAALEVDIAEHGKEAIALLEKNTYDLIITDLQMPEMDGFQTTAYIRNKLALQIPIIAMTASALRNEKDRCLELGMNEYLTKPFAPAALFFHLERLLLKNANETTAEPMLTAQEEKEEFYNLSFLYEMEDNDYTAEVLEIFLSSTPAILLEIKEHVFREEWNQVYRKAHSLKSGLGILQMHSMLHTVTEIETTARNENNTDSIETLLQDAIQQYNLIKPMLEAELEATRKKPVL